MLGLDQDLDKEARVRLVLEWADHPITKQFIEIMRKDEEISLRDVPIDSDNWSHKQAYVNGQRTMLRKLERLTKNV